MSDSRPAIPPELLGQTEFLRALARGLLRDEQASEDVVQSAWLEALERRPAELRNPLAWMASVTRNLARDWRRAEGRRAARERSAARPEALPSAGELAEREGTLRAVTEAVLALDEPYRATILLRYHEGLELAEIARRGGEPLATVRSRHTRALERLRERLDRAHGGERRTWALGLVSLVGAGASPGALAPVTAGPLLVGSSSKLAGVLLLALLGLLGAWRIWASPRAATLESAGPAPELASAASATHAREPRTAALPPGSRAPALPTSTPAPTHGSLSARVTWSDGTPAEGVTVSVVRDDERPQLAELRRTDATGRIHLAEVLPGALSLRLDRGAQVTNTRVEAGATAEAELTVPAGVDVNGRVLDRGGAPVAGAELWLTAPTDTSEALAVERSDANGRFQLRAIEAWKCLEARKAGHAPSPALHVLGEPGERVELTLVLQGRGSGLALRLTGPDGRAVAGARTLLSSLDRESYPTEGYPQPVPRHERPQRVWLVSDAQGRCEAPGLPPGPTEVVVVAPALASYQTTVELVAGTTQALDIALDAGLTLQGTVRASDGAPLAGVEVEAGAGSADAWRAAWSGDDGHFVLPHLAAGELAARAQLVGLGRASTTLRGALGAVLEWNPVLDLGRVLRGRLVDERGLALEHWELAAVTGPRGTGAPHAIHGTTSTGDAGLFSISNCPDGALRLVVREPAGRAVFPAAEFEGVEAAPGVLELRVLDAWRASASIRGRTLDDGGAPLAAELRLSEPDGESWSTCASPRATGDFEFALLAPGRYTLEASAGDGARLPPRTLAVEAGQELDLGELVLGARGTLALALAPDVAREDALALTSVWARPLPSGAPVFELSPADLPRELELPCGDYELNLAGMVVSEDPPVVHVESGRATRLELRPRRGAYVGLSFRLPAGRKLPLELELVLRTHAGDEVVRTRRSLALHDGLPPESALRLALLVPPGSEYEVEAIGPEGLRGDGVIGPVGANEPGRIPLIEIELR